MEDITTSKETTEMTKHVYTTNPPIIYRGYDSKSPAKVESMVSDTTTENIIRRKQKWQQQIAY
jgi:hypothetical protein